MAPTFEELTAELKSLKKRLYTFKLKGLELQQKARSHMSTHRLSSSAGATTEESPEVAENLCEVFGSNPQSTPLSNEYILEMIASYLPLRDLQNSRLVCKLWAKEMSRCELKRKSIVVAYENDCEEVEALVKEKLAGNIVNISTLIVLSTSLECSAVQRIVHNFGSTISSLRLDECMIEAGELYNLLRYLPCLEDLTVKKNDLTLQSGIISPLDQITTDNYSPSLVLPYLRILYWEDQRKVKALERLPKLFPNLIYLKISHLGNCNPALFNDVRWDSLKSLKLSLSFSSSHQANQLQSLVICQFKLRKISISNVMDFNIIGGYRRMKLLQHFLESSNETLEQLSLFYSNDKCASSLQHKHTPIPTIKMTAMKSLTIDIGLISSLQLLNNTPNVQKLLCKANYWINWWKILGKNPPRVHLALNELSLGSIDSDCLEKIAKSFPNISSLEFVDDCVDNKFFRTICSNFSKLRVLKITKSDKKRKRTRSQLSDFGITGIPQDYAKLLIDVKTGVNPTRVYPNVIDLKELESLDIARAPILTNISVLHGFSKLPNLNVLNLPKCKVTDACLNQCTDFVFSKDSNGCRRIRTHRQYSDDVSNTILNFLRRKDNSNSIFGYNLDQDQRCD